MTEDEYAEQVSATFRAFEHGSITRDEAIHRWVDLARDFYRDALDELAER